MVQNTEVTGVNLKDWGFFAAYKLKLRTEIAADVLCNVHNWYCELPHDKNNKMACAPSVDSDQPAASAQSDQSSLSEWRKLGPLATH